MFHRSGTRITHRPRPSRVAAPLRWLGTGMSLLLFCFSLLAALVLVVIPAVSGSQTYSVLTNSMSPSYPPGTFLVVKPRDFDSLRPGDVVTYQVESGKPAVITHRIVGFSSDQEGNRLLVTKGDNNGLADDDPVMELQVRGELAYAVPYVGHVANALGNTDRTTVGTALAVGLIGYGVCTIVRGWSGWRRGARRGREALAPAEGGPA